MVQQRKQEEEEERRRQESHAAQRAERAKVKQASLSKLQESWTTQSHTTLSKPGGKGGRGGQQSDQAPHFESGSEEDDGDVLSENEEEGVGQADRYGDGAGANDAQAPLRPANLKDIGLSSSSDDSDGVFGGDEDGQDGAGQKRKWDSDDEDGQAGEQATSPKRRTVGDSD